MNNKWELREKAGSDGISEKVKLNEPTTQIVTTVFVYAVKSMQSNQFYAIYSFCIAELNRHCMQELVRRCFIYEILLHTYIIVTYLPTYIWAVQKKCWELNFIWLYIITVKSYCSRDVCNSVIQIAKLNKKHNISWFFGNSYGNIPILNSIFLLLSDQEPTHQLTWNKMTILLD